MNAPLRSMMAHVCATSAVVVMTTFAIGSIYVYIDSTIDPSTRERHAAIAPVEKADRLAVPDVTITVARDGKADGHFSSVALRTINGTDFSNANRLARAADPSIGEEKAPVVLDVVVETVAEDPSPSDGDGLVIEPVANGGGADTNVSEETREQSTRSDTPWGYPREVFERAGERAQVLWDILFGTD